MIVFELVDESLEVTLDREGIDVLRAVLDHIKDGGHEHLATPSWGGYELSEAPLHGGTMINQVTFGVRRP